MGAVRKARGKLRRLFGRTTMERDTSLDSLNTADSKTDIEAGKNSFSEDKELPVWRAAVAIARPFFLGVETRRTAILLSIAMGVLITLETWVIMYFSKVNKDYMTALQKKDEEQFYKGLWRVGYVIAMILPVVGLHQYVQTTLHLAWRTALTKRLTKAYLTCSSGGHGAFYHMNLSGQVDNPDQRICQDAKAFVDATLSLVVDTVSTVFKVCGFAGLLYSISPEVCMGVVGYAALGTLVSTIGFGKWVMKYQQDALSQEATLRYCLIRTRENAESIAFFRGGNAEWQRFEDFFDTLMRTLKRQMVVMTGFNMFQRTFNWATFAVAPLLVGPAYMRGDAEFGDISQAAMAFNVILGGLTMIMNKLDKFCHLAVEVRRLHGLQQALDHEEARASVVASAVHGAGEGLCVALRELQMTQPEVTAPGFQRATTLPALRARQLPQLQSDDPAGRIPTPRQTSTDLISPGPDEARLHWRSSEGKSTDEASFQIGMTVDVCDNGEETWRVGTISSFSPLRVCVVGWNKSFQFDKVRLTQGTTEESKSSKADYGLVLQFEERNGAQDAINIFLVQLASTGFDVKEHRAVAYDAQGKIVQEHALSALQRHQFPVKYQLEKAFTVLRVSGLTLRTPPRTGAVAQTLLENLSLHLRAGESVLVAGTSGIGKSSLLRGIAGLWSDGQGAIERCGGKHVFFMPQHPYMFLGSLREQLLYPDVQRLDATPGMLADALEKVNLRYLLQRHSWDDTKDWASLLSLGEQQRINFARVLLAKDVQLALIDEGTSACDTANEARLYELLREKVGSYVSVGHRPNLRRYHTHMLRLERKRDSTSAASSMIDAPLGPAVGQMMPVAEANKRFPLESEIMI